MLGSVLGRPLMESLIWGPSFGDGNATADNENPA